MTTENTNQKLHAEHRAWLADLGLWQDELTEWRTELGRALEDLRNAEVTLRAHAQGLDRHAVELDVEQEAIRQHECGIAIVERMGVGLEAGAHSEAAAKHPARRATHERLKKYHHTIMARVSLLLKAIAQPV